MKVTVMLVMLVGFVVAYEHCAPVIRSRGAEEQTSAGLTEAERELVKRLQTLAESESQKFGIPKEVYLAVALTTVKENPKVLKHNGLFGVPVVIPGKSEWGGKVFRENGREFRKYDSAWGSFRDFSVFTSAICKRNSKALDIVKALNGKGIGKNAEIYLNKLYYD